MKTACIAYAHGCKRAEAEIKLIYEYLKKNDIRVIEDQRHADMVLVCTCGFDASSEIVSLKFLSRTVKVARPDAVLIAFGCLAGINEEAIREICGDRLILIPPRNLDALDGIIRGRIAFQVIRNGQIETTFYVKQNVLFKARVGPSSSTISESINVRAKRAFTTTDRLWINLSSARSLFDKCISRFGHLLGPVGLFQRDTLIPGLLLSGGCPGECTYCGIRRAAGPLNSIPLETIRARFRYLLAGDHQTIALVAADVGSYGLDIDKNVVELFEALFEVREKFHLMISDFHPRWLTQYADELIRIFSLNQDRIDHISIPVQSGSEKILALMKRRVTAADILKHVGALRKDAPDLPLTTHVLVGFPGETDDDFDRTLDLLHRLQFDSIYVFCYSERPGTETSGFPDQVSKWVKRRRLFKLRREFPGVAN